MILVIQRVSRAAVEVEDRVVGEIRRGFLVLLGAEKGDGERVAQEAARKVAGLRVFEDGSGKMNLCLSEISGSALVVPQFTLAADLSRGRRPGFDRALAPDAARPLYEVFLKALSELGVPVRSGTFGATMRVSLVNEGPATFLLEVPSRARGAVGGKIIHVFSADPSTGSGRGRSRAGTPRGRRGRR